MKIEVCSNCHPFFTGQQKFVDTAGRVEKFLAKVEKTKARQASAKEAADKKAKTNSDKNAVAAVL